MNRKARHIFLGIICLAFSFLKAQRNLVLNGGFEDTLWCQPCGNPSILKFNHCYNSSNGSPDAYHYCCYNSFTFNSTKPRNGWGRVGLYLYQSPYTDAREYPQLSILDSLLPNRQYCLTFYARSANFSRSVSPSIGAKFSSSLISIPTQYTIGLAPDILNQSTNFIDTTSYVVVKGIYSSIGGEKYITIGNFADDNNSNIILKYPGTQIDVAYITIDDVSLTDASPPELGHDITICATSDSVLIGEEAWAETSYKWYANGAPIDSIHGQIKVKPNTTTTFVLQKQNCLSTSDTIVVSVVSDCPVTNDGDVLVPNVFTPNEDNKNDTWRVILPIGSTFKRLTIYNRWGNHIFQPDNHSQSVLIWDGRTTSGEPCSEGTYFFALQYIDSKGESIEKKGFISLFR